jgi:hypothetical protein
LDPFNPDIYIASWNQIDYQSGRTVNYKKKVTPNDFTKFIGRYKIKKIQIFDEEEGLRTAAAKFVKSRLPSNAKDAFIKMAKQFLIIQKGIELIGNQYYDVIIRIRPDNMYMGKIRQSELMLRSNEFKCVKPKRLRLNDHFFAVHGSRRQMLSTLFDRSSSFKRGKFWPEDKINKILDEKRIQITYFNSNFRAKLGRHRHHHRNRYHYRYRYSS